MAMNKKKQDEKNLKMLREMVALPHNKTCFDCHQRGPTYVDMAVGSFICTSCSGLLRGLNPPHRVKSISMTSFTPEEMDFLRQRGNDLCRRVWLGLYDSRSYAEPDSKDENKVKDFMCQKYEKKRWYVAPTEAMYAEAKRQNTPPAPPSKSDSRPLKSLVGGNVPSLIVNSNKQSPQQRPQANASPASVAQPKPSPPQPALPTQPTAHTAPQKTPSGFDLLGDLGGDPFAQPSNAQAAAPGGGFADFSAFSQGSTQQSAFPPPASVAPGFPAQPSQPQPGAPVFAPASSANPAFPPPASSSFPSSSANGMLQPVSNAGVSGASPPFTTTSTAPGMVSASDRYAALANLDSVLGTSSTPAGSAIVNWDSSGLPGAGAPPPSRGPINWGGGGLPQSSAEGMIGVGGNAYAQASNAGFGANFGGLTTTTSTTNPFQTSAANPFSQQPPAFNQPPPQQQPQQQQHQPVSNPFMASPMPPSSYAPMPTATSAGFGGMPANTMAAGYPGAVPPPYGAIQNGNYGPGVNPGQMQQQPQASAAPGQWGQPPAGVANPTNMQMNAFGGAQQQAAGFGKPAGAMPQNQFGNWGMPQQTATHNPFMGVATQAQVPPRSHSSNPFL